ncbi:hypothetical protein NMG60_11007934 [Bertholletia excelsa]
MSSKFGACENPWKWRFTWEAQSHIPSLKLLLFNYDINPSNHCKNLQVSIEQSLLIASWFEGEDKVSLRVPIPRVLIDAESPVQYRALYDHIEVKLVLLLPVDHPILANLGSVLSLSEDECYGENEDDLTPLLMDSDVKSLSCASEVQFYCRSCSTQLTRSLRTFAEMPSSNWREVADNWFGACCCSFGGVGEKLVNRYANSYAPLMGMCLLSSTFVVLCQDDLVGCQFPCSNTSQTYGLEVNFNGNNCSTEAALDNGSNYGEASCSGNEKNGSLNFNRDFQCSDPVEDNLVVNLEHQVSEIRIGSETLLKAFPASESSEGVVSVPHCCLERTRHVVTHKIEDCSLEAAGASLEEQKPITDSKLLTNRKSFLNGFLGDVFMARPPYLSNDVQWIEFLCPKCSCFLGAYPSNNGRAPLDGGVRLFKCYISTCLSLGGSNDLFRKYTVERMFSNQLLRNAKEELSFRTVVRDLQTKSAMLQIVLLNPISWHYSDYCLGIDNTLEPVGKVDLLPAIKLLFLDCCNNTESQMRMVEEWITKNQVDEVYMFSHLVKELIKCLHSSKDVFPSSCTVLEGLFLSSMRR